MQTQACRGAGGKLQTPPPGPAVALPAACRRLGAANRARHLTASFLRAFFSPHCHRFFPQNKYLMLLLSLHLIKMYRICAVNSNETNKTRPLS